MYIKTAKNISKKRESDRLLTFILWRKINMGMTKNRLGIMQLACLRVDGLEPSQDMLEMIEKEIKGKMRTDEIRANLIKNYKKTGKAV